MQVLSCAQGLIPTTINRQTGSGGAAYSVGAAADSYYEYLLKLWLLDGQKVCQDRLVGYWTLMYHCHGVGIRGIRRNMTGMLLPASIPAPLPQASSVWHHTQPAYCGRLLLAKMVGDLLRGLVDQIAPLTRGSSYV